MSHVFFQIKDSIGQSSKDNHKGQEVTKNNSFEIVHREESIFSIEL